MDAVGQAAGRGEINGMRVLLVEDSWLVALGLQSILENMGVVVSGPVATVAEAAARLGETGRFDAAVVDMNLRGEMAYDLVDRLNERDIPVVVVTGYEVLPSLADKAVTILQKPLRAKPCSRHCAASLLSIERSVSRQGGSLLRARRGIARLPARSKRRSALHSGALIDVSLLWPSLSNATS